MSTSSTYTSPETGKTYTVVAGGTVTGKDYNGTVQTAQSGTAVSGTQMVADAAMIMLPPANVWGTVSYPVSQVIVDGAAAIDSNISGTSYLSGGLIISEDRMRQESATQIIESGGFASNTYLGPVTTSIINNGGVSDNVSIMGGWLQTNAPLSPSASVLFSATQIVSSGGILHTATLGSSGTLILNGGSADHITVGTGTVLQKPEHCQMCS